MRREARNPQAEAEFLAGRPGNGPFLLRGADYGLRLHESYEQTMRLRDWMRGAEAKLNALVRPPALQTLLTFGQPDLRRNEPPEGLFLGPKVYNDAQEIYEKARTLADTLVKMIEEFEKPERQAIMQLLRVDWLIMTAAASLNLRVDIEGANRAPLGRREIALLEMTFMLREEDEALTDDHLNYLSSQKARVEAAVNVLANSDMYPQYVAELPGSPHAR